MEHVSGIVKRVIADLEKNAVIQTTGSDPAVHEFKDDVDRFMAHLKKAISLRVEAERCSRSTQFAGGAKWQADINRSSPLKKESERMIRDAEYMVYELIDNAMEEGALYVSESEV